MTDLMGRHLDQKISLYSKKCDLGGQQGEVWNYDVCLSIPEGSLNKTI